MPSKPRTRHPDKCPVHGDTPAPHKKCRVCKALAQRQSAARARAGKLLKLVNQKPHGVVSLSWPAPRIQMNDELLLTRNALSNLVAALHGCPDWLTKWSTPDLQFAEREACRLLGLGGSL